MPGGSNQLHVSLQIHFTIVNHTFHVMEPDSSLEDEDRNGNAHEWGFLFFCFLFCLNYAKI